MTQEANCKWRKVQVVEPKGVAQELLAALDSAICDLAIEAEVARHNRRGAVALNTLGEPIRELRAIYDDLCHLLDSR